MSVLEGAFNGYHANLHWSSLRTSAISSHPCRGSSFHGSYYRRFTGGAGSDPRSNTRILYYGKRAMRPDLYSSRACSDNLNGEGWRLNLNRRPNPNFLRAGVIIHIPQRYHSFRTSLGPLLLSVTCLAIVFTSACHRQ